MPPARRILRWRSDTSSFVIIVLSPALTAVTLLLFVPLLFILVYSFWLRTATGADQAGFFLDNWREALSACRRKG